MNMTIIEELKSDVKINKFYFKDIIFVIAFFAVSFCFKGYVSGYLEVPFIIFSVIVSIILVMPSKSNSKRRVWQAIRYIINKDNTVYTPICVNERSDDFEVE